MRPILTHGSLFAGIEGFGVGFNRAGFKTLFQVEWDPDCQCILRRHFPGVALYSDIREVDPAKLAHVDVITYGFPCVDLSVAGKRAGLKGARSGLFYEAIRIITGVRPAICVFENVPGLLSSDGGDDFRAVLRALADSGYCPTAWLYPDSQCFGVAQRRTRVYGISASEAVPNLGERLGQEVRAITQSLCGDITKGREAGQEVAAGVGSGIVGCLSPGAHPGGLNGQDVDKIIAIRIDPPGANGDGVIENGTAHTLGGATDAVCIKSECIGRSDSAGPQFGTGAKTELAFTLESTQQPHAVAYHRNASCIGFRPNQSAAARSLGAHEEQSAILPSEPGGNLACVAVTHPLTSEGADASEDGTGRGVPLVAHSMRSKANLAHREDADTLIPCNTVVRRLLPVECERLQGFPDNWTAWGIDANGKRKEMKDSPRYRMLGNAVTTSVAYWIAEIVKRPILAAINGDAGDGNALEPV